MRGKEGKGLEIGERLTKLDKRMAGIGKEWAIVDGYLKELYERSKKAEEIFTLFDIKQGLSEGVDDISAKDFRVIVQANNDILEADNKAREAMTEMIADYSEAMKTAMEIIGSLLAGYEEAVACSKTLSRLTLALDKQIKKGTNPEAEGSKKN